MKPMVDTHRTTIPIQGMSCSHCVQRVQDALEGIDGVTAADVDLDAEQATVGHDASVSRDQLAEAITEAGYNAPAAA